MGPELGKWYQEGTRYLFRADKIENDVTQGIRINVYPDSLVIDDMIVSNHLFGRSIREVHHLFKKTILMKALNDKYEITYRNREWNLTTSK